MADFEAFDKTSTPFTFPGVYAYLRKGRPVYIGQSQHIPTRMREHRGKKWFEEDLEIRVLWCQDEEVRFLTETIMILRERPRWNRGVKVGMTTSGRLYELHFKRQPRK